MKGQLIYVMGPSGAGKDTLLDYARAQLVGMPVLFAHRYITRAADAGGENHIALTQPEFAGRSALGLFALEWQSHGMRYGIGREIDVWLACGATVVINGSRAYCRDALTAYPGMRVVLIEAGSDVLARRLVSRGRESEQQILDRLAHAPKFEMPAGVRMIRIDNSGSLARGGGVLAEVLSIASCWDGA